MMIILALKVFQPVLLAVSYWEKYHAYFFHYRLHLLTVVNCHSVLVDIDYNFDISPKLKLASKTINKLVEEFEIWGMCFYTDFFVSNKPDSW